MTTQTLHTVCTLLAIIVLLAGAILGSLYMEKLNLNTQSQYAPVTGKPFHASNKIWWERFQAGFRGDV